MPKAEACASTSNLTPFFFHTTRQIVIQILSYFHCSVKLLLVPTNDDILPIRGFESP